MIQLNGKEVTWNRHETIRNLLDNYNIGGEMITISVNGKIISDESINQIYLKDGDHVKVIYPIVGG